MRTIIALAGAFVCANFSAVAQQPTFKIDHFKCYFPEQATQVQPSPVQLLDQFGPSNTAVGKIYRLCNPTKKVHNGVVTPINHPDDHLTLHVTGPQALVTRTVKIRNQFGERVITTQDARVLAVPTQKDPHGPPQQLNHFSCYVAQGAAVNESVGLSDQFYDSKHKVGSPVLFCNPVQKWHNGAVTPVSNPDDHLTCYSMSRDPFSRTVDLHNQFGDHRFQSKYADMLCVPTKKLGWVVTD